MANSFASVSLKNVEGDQLFQRAKLLYAQGDYINALEVIEDLSFVNLTETHDMGMVNFMQGYIFNELSDQTDKIDVKVTYLLASVEIFSPYIWLLRPYATSLFQVAELLDSLLYYKRALVKAKQHEDAFKKNERVTYIIETAESKIAESKTVVASTVQKHEESVKESNDSEETRKSDSDLVKRLKSYWAGLDVEARRNFMKVYVPEFRSFIEQEYGREGLDALTQVLASAKEDRKWMFWMCRTCSKKFSSADDCKNHVEQAHNATLIPNRGNGVVEMISEAFANKISVGGWDPVDAVAAVGMIKNQLEDVKAFAYENGWSKDWPLAADEKRSGLLREIQQLLVSFYDCKVSPCSLQDCLEGFVVEKLDVSKDILAECRLLETPQSICFLELGELDEIREILKSIKCERNDGTDLVSRAVDSFCGGTRVKEKIDFDPKFSFLLLDKRLLQGKIAQFDDEGTIITNNPNAHYAKAQAHGDDIISLLDDNSSRDETFRFPQPIRTHNLDIWVAVLKAIQYLCRTLGAKYQKKDKLLCFDTTLNEIKNLCMLEAERRKNIPKDQWTSYATRICDKYEKLLPRTYLSTTRMNLWVVRHVLEAANELTFDCPESEDSLNVMSEHKNVGDDSVLSSIENLKTVVTNKISYKVPRIDSKILLIENSRINLLNQLIRLSVFDYRSYILGPLKEFVLQGILDMESKAKIAAANADLLLEEEEEKKPQSKKKKNEKKQKPSTSMPGPLDKTTEHKPEYALSSDTGQLETAETIVEHEPEPTVSSERSQLENSSNTDNQEEAAKGDSQLTNMAGESLLSKQLESTHGAAATRCKYALEMTLKALSSDMGQWETSSNTDQLTDMAGESSSSKQLESTRGASATRCKSALEMTLKALCNIQVLKEYLVRNQDQFPENIAQVPSALRNFFVAFASETIKGAYCCLLEDLLALLESRDAAGVLKSILEFWPCWKNPEIESVVTHLFTLKEDEKMSCRKCGNERNVPEQSSYVIDMAADSVRDLKGAFENMKFEDILKMNRREEKMLCECGKANYVHRIMRRRPFIFTIVLGWVKDETDEEISETTKALDSEIDISRLYEGFEPNKKFRLSSMVGYGEEDGYICLAYKTDRWCSLKDGALSEEDVGGDWESVVRFCGQRKVRLEILFYEDASLMT